MLIHLGASSVQLSLSRWHGTTSVQALSLKHSKSVSMSSAMSAVCPNTRISQDFKSLDWHILSLWSLRTHWGEFEQDQMVSKPSANQTAVPLSACSDTPSLGAVSQSTASSRQPAEQAAAESSRSSRQSSQSSQSSQQPTDAVATHTTTLQPQYH